MRAAAREDGVELKDCLDGQAGHGMGASGQLVVGRKESGQEALGVSLAALAASPGLTRSRNSLEGLK